MVELVCFENIEMVELVRLQVVSKTVPSFAGAAIAPPPLAAKPKPPRPLPSGPFGVRCGLLSEFSGFGAPFSRLAR
jgi:hypothetical protein